MRPDTTAAVGGATMWTALQITPVALAQAVAILLGAWLFSALLRRALNRSVAGGRLDPGVRYSLSRLMHLAILVIAILLALNALGVGLGTLAVVAGALGIGIGFGLQSIAANFVSGLVLLFERPIRVGDRISLGSIEADALGAVNGYVKAIHLRATTVVTPDSITLIVPNIEFVTRTVVNWSHGDPRMRIRLNIGVAYDSDLELVRRVIDEVARASPRTLNDPPPEVRMVDTADSALVFQLLVWIPEPRDRGRAESELRWEMVRRFREAGITIPFPQRQVELVGDERSPRRD